MHGVAPDPTPSAGPRPRLLTTLRNHARKVVVGVVGFTVLLGGLVLFIAPLPVGWFLIPLGLVILAAEFAFARRWLQSLETRTGPVGRGLGRARRWAEGVTGRRGDPDRPACVIEPGISTQPAAEPSAAASSSTSPATPAA